jgi:CRISPR/Cas system CMR-associated protein Cmr5 small subunit
MILAVILLATGVPDFVQGQSVKSGAGVVSSGSEDQAKVIDLWLKILVGVFAAGAAGIALSRSLVFGSSRAAQMYTELRSDPLGPIVALFQKLVKAIRRPVVVFVDDLDRCERKYVIELLEGIQTLFRSAPMAYVVVADRKWICSSFEKEYEDFSKTIGEPGRPLGYLFLDKIFQVSSSVPQLLPEIRRRYWNGLLNTHSADDPKAQDDKRKQAEREALKKIEHIHTKKELDEKIAEVSRDPLKEQAMRAAAARQITTSEARRETEHRLQRFDDMLEPNPRSMKRLVNTVGLHQARHFLEGRNVPLESLARWTIIELRWPLLADLLTAHPHFAVNLAEGTTLTDGTIPKELKNLFRNEDVKRVMAADPSRGITKLDDISIRQIIGIADQGQTAGSPPNLNHKG